MICLETAQRLLNCDNLPLVSNKLTPQRASSIVISQQKKYQELKEEEREDEEEQEEAANIVRNSQATQLLEFSEKGQKLTNLCFQEKIERYMLAENLNL